MVDSLPSFSTAKVLLRKTVVPPSSLTGGREPSGLTWPRKVSEKIHSSLPPGSLTE
jgi:hypothetical protein